MRFLTSILLLFMGSFSFADLSEEKLQYYDVYALSELPSLAKGLRYFDFIGGTKELRCFIVPEETPRNEFIEKNEDLLDPCLKPIYKNQGIIVKQDASFPLPGFYIVCPTKHYRSLDEMDEVTHLRLFFILREIRRGMREVLGIEHAHVFYEEKANKSCNVHYWILPIQDIVKYPRIYELDVKKYLEQFSFTKERDNILDFNQKMIAFIEEIDLLQRDNQLMKRL